MFLGKMMQSSAREAKLYSQFDGDISTRINVSISGKKVESLPDLWL